MPPSSSRAAKTTKPAAAEPSGSTADRRVFLFAGAEAGRKLAELHKLTAQFVDADFADFDADLLDGNSATADRVLGGAATFPLGAGRRVVVVRDTQQMDEAEQKKLAAGLAKIPATGMLLLHAGTPVVEDGKTRKQTIVATELANAVKKVGRVLEFTLPRADDLRDWLISQARDLGKTLAPDAISLLAQLPNEDVGRAKTELEKAAAHAGDAPVITGADVEATLSRGADDVIFKLCDAVGMRRTPEALGHVSTLFKGGQRPDSVAPRALVLLARQIRLLAQFRYLGDKRMAGRGAGPVTPDVLALFPSDGAAGMLANPRTSWMTDKYVSQARNYSGGELASRLEKLLHADLALKGIVPGGDDPRVLMQRLVIELCERGE